MVFALKKHISVLLACAALLGLLGSCTITRVHKDSAEISAGAAAAHHPKTDEDLNAVAAALIAKDMWAIDFLVNLKMDGKYIYDSTGEPGLSYYPVNTPDYADFDNLCAELDTIYCSPGSYSRFFAYPIFGDPQVFDLYGETYVYPHYITDFEAKIDTGSIKTSELAPDTVSVSFDILNHDFFTDGSMPMIKTAEGWRLEKSFFFHCAGRLDLLDVENAVLWEDNPILAPDQNAGSAKRFTGECMFYNIFVEDDASPWDDDAISELYELQNEAFRYLEIQAELFGHELRCYATGADSSLYLATDMHIPEQDATSDTYWFDLMVMEAGYGSVNGLLEALSEGQAYDNYGIIVNVNKQGRSYAIPCNPVFYDHGDYYAERTVVYYSTDTDYEYVLCSATVAHELLHLFGATDLYYPYDGEDIRKQLVIQYFPFELMHYVPHYVYSATVSAYTAFRVGWRNTLPEQLMMFQAEG